MIDEGIRQQVLDATDIVALVGRYHGLRKAGKNYTMLCAWHADKNTESFNVDSVKQSFKCYGCGIWGNAISFLMLQERLSYPQAVKLLAAEAGIEIPERKPDGLGEMRDFLQWATTQYNRQLDAPEGAPAHRYLEGRGVTPAQANQLEFGVAKNYLTRQLASDKEKLELGVRAGVFGRKQKEGSEEYYYWDFLFDRLVLPIRNSAGEVIALSGRALDDRQPKYLNGPNTPLFDKSSCFYGLDPQSVRMNGALIVEGQFDQTTLFLAGETHAGATCGTAFTEKHVSRLRRLTSRAVFCRDGDPAGMKALLADIRLSGAGGLTPYVLELPEGEDPDSFVRKNGIEAFRAIRARDGFEYLLDRCEGSVLSKKQWIHEQIVPYLKNCPDAIEQALLVQKAARSLLIPQGAFYETLGLAGPELDSGELSRVLHEEVVVKSRKFRYGYLREHGSLHRLFQGERLAKVEALLKEDERGAPDEAKELSGN